LTQTPQLNFVAVDELINLMMTIFALRGTLKNLVESINTKMIGAAHRLFQTNVSSTARYHIAIQALWSRTMFMQEINAHLEAGRLMSLGIYCLLSNNHMLLYHTAAIRT